MAKNKAQRNTQKDEKSEKETLVQKVMELQAESGSLPLCHPLYQPWTLLLKGHRDTGTWGWGVI